MELNRAKAVECLHQDIARLLSIKARLPLLRELRDELKRLDPNQTIPVRNDALLLVMQDSFDMLVIELCSLRERMTREGGIFYSLQEYPGLLRKLTPEDIEDQPIIGHGKLTPEDAQRQVKEMLLQSCNAVFIKLFSDRKRARKTHIEALRLRFKQETLPTNDDRNNVRAHRQEKHMAANHFQSLTQVEEQIKIFESYLNDLLLVVNRSNVPMRAMVIADTAQTATDIADIICHGSISTATQEYGLAKPLEEDGPEWYSEFREQYFRKNQVSFRERIEK